MGGLKHLKLSVKYRLNNSLGVSKEKNLESCNNLFLLILIKILI